MLNIEVNDYIKRQLRAGVNPLEIANKVHGWGWRTENVILANEVQSPSPSRAEPQILNIVMGIIMVSAVLFGGVLLYRSTNPQTISIADAVVTPDPFPKQPLTKTTAQANSETSVLGVSTDSAELSLDKTATSSSNLADKNNVNTSVPSKSVSKSEYRIALIGDSMIDTLDSHLPMLSDILNAKYNAQFKIYNYGVGAQNVEMGLAGFSQPFNYKDREYPALSELKPDIIIIGSFAYNPFSQHDVNKYWLTMAKLAEASQATGASVYFLADIAPLKEKFGIGSLDWTTDIRASHSQKIVDQLNSFIALSETLNLQLIDVYSVTQAAGQFGNGKFTDTHDGIHASNEGRQLVINQISEDLVIE